MSKFLFKLTTAVIVGTTLTIAFRLAGVHDAVALPIVVFVNAVILTV